MCCKNPFTAPDLSKNTKIDDLLSSWNDQFGPGSLFGMWDVCFYLAAILGNNVASITDMSITDMRQGDGSPLPVRADFDYSTGILLIDEITCIPAIIYAYDVQAPGELDKPMDVLVSLIYPIRVAVLRAGTRISYTYGETDALPARGEDGTAPYSASVLCGSFQWRQGRTAQPCTS